MATSLEKYLANHPNKDIYDLSQSQKRARTSLVGGQMPCLATSSTFLWSNKMNRCYTGREKLKSLLCPVEGMDLTIFSERALTRFAGNGMFLPNVGWALLAHILCAEAV